jgi:hypothetical protein
MRGRTGGETTAEGPVSVGVWAATGHAVPRTEKPAAQTIAIRYRRVIAAMRATSRDGIRRNSSRITKEFEPATFSLGEGWLKLVGAWPGVHSQTFWRAGPGGFTHVAAGAAPHQRERDA